MSDLQKELQLCSALLNLDARNFNVWNYRRSVCSRANVCPQSEFDFTTMKIKEDFSNFSAWHYRTKLIPQLVRFQQKTIEEYWQLIEEEFTFVKAALFTDPQDQSGWFYHRWLLGNISQLQSKTNSEILRALGQNEKVEEEEEKLLFNSPLPDSLSPLFVFSRELSVCRELDDLESGQCRWVLLTIVVLLSAIAQIEQNLSIEVSDEMSQLFQRLRQLDPIRTHYYEHLQLTLQSHQQKSRSSSATEKLSQNGS